MKTYSVSLWGDIIVDAKNEKEAIKEAYRQLNAGDDDNVVMDFLSSLEVEEDGVIEQVRIVEECMYDHDHTKGGCEYHD